MHILTLEKVDSDQKYVYQTGEHIIGRGPELECTSKKVSRKHAILKVTVDGVFIESTHNNPCYHQTKDKNIQIICYTKSAELNHEDKIALALDHGWFTVKITKSEVTENNNKRELDAVDEATEAKKIKLNDDANVVQNDLQDTNVVQNDLQDTNVVQNDLQDTNDLQNDINNEEAEHVAVKTEPLDSSLNASTNEPETSANTSDQVKDEPEDDTKKDATATASTSSRRDRCWYGSSCYRKNPNHRASFSHPNDNDYDSDPNDNRPICCYGINCYRRNRLHREKYRHPGQDKVPPPPSKKKRKQSPLTPTKRQTKNVNYYNDDDEEDDYDLDDPFINDGDDSDEYEPESSDTESDDDESSQSQNTEEDTKQLLKDARKFARRN